jgi:hypothetical protein
MSVLIGADFSINKPAVCILKNNQYHFISWPYGLSKPQIEAYKKSPITIIDRTDDKDKGDNISDKLRYEVSNAKYLANLIMNSISSFVNKDTFMAFEGLSYGSTGDVVLQLGGYKYILMDVLSSIIPLENMYTYAPITIKKTAGCSKKGTKKADMIEAFKLMPTEFSKYIRSNEEIFKTKNGNWIAHLDDIVDSYWALETLREKL